MPIVSTFVQLYDGSGGGIGNNLARSWRSVGMGVLMYVDDIVLVMDSGVGGGAAD